jgi:similar to stage IV sporulation protein
MVRKTGIRTKLVRKTGLPFVLAGLRKRSGLVIGLMGVLCFLYVMSLHIWSIVFDGNTYYSDDILMDHLKTIGIQNGMISRGIDCDSVEKSLRMAFDGITWVSVEIDGTLLRVNIKEELNQETMADNVTGGYDLVAEDDGIVDSIITRTGTPQVRVGDEVTKGQVLISGIIDLHNDDGTVVSQRLVCADGDVFLQRVLEMDLRVDQSYEVEQTVQEQHGLYIAVPGYEEHFLLPVSSDYPARRETTIHQLRLFENYYLPIFYGTVDISYYDTQICFYQEEEFKIHCQEVLEEELENLKKKGVEIMENHVIIQSDDLCAYLRGSLVLRQRTGALKPVELSQDETDGSQ